MAWLMQRHRMDVLMNVDNTRLNNMNTGRLLDRGPHHCATTTSATQLFLLNDSSDPCLAHLVHSRYHARASISGVSNAVVLSLHSSPASQRLLLFIMSVHAVGPPECLHNAHLASACTCSRSCHICLSSAESKIRHTVRAHAAPTAFTCSV
jgi:hypothetical protein